MQIKGYNFGFGTMIYSHVPYLITFFKIISILPMFNPKFFIITARKPRSLSGGLCPGQEGLCQGGLCPKFFIITARKPRSLSGGLCPGQEGLCQGGLCPGGGGLCPRGSRCPVGVSVSVQRGVSFQGVSVQGSLSGRPPVQ